jgi:hypothetical protein
MEATVQIPPEMTEHDRRLILEDETFLLRDSGELPEIAYHSSLHYLTVDQDGPGLILTEDELKLLQAAAMDRCQEIVLRDLEPENRDLRIYRGPRRSIYNWHRYCSFCQRVGWCPDDAFRKRVAQALIRFIRREAADVRAGLRTSSVNCAVEELLAFAEQVGVANLSSEFVGMDLCLKR